MHVPSGPTAAALLSQHAVGLQAVALRFRSVAGESCYTLAWPAEACCEVVW